MYEDEVFRYRGELANDGLIDPKPDNIHVFVNSLTLTWQKIGAYKVFVDNNMVIFYVNEQETSRHDTTGYSLLQLVTLIHDLLDGTLTNLEQ